MPLATAAELARDLRTRKLDPVELAEACLKAIAANEDQAVFVEVLAARALKEAKAARRRLRAKDPASPLDGVPVAWKDLFDLKGRVTTAASLVLKSNPPAAHDAGLVAAGAKAGLVSLGCTNMTEFAYSGIGLNPHYGTPRNPHGGEARVPGGSSSGSGVAVARRLVPIAIGTDTGGSIRIPASFNGVVGYKSSTGHYPMAGVFPLSRTLDSLGPFARTVEDCVLADAALRGLKRARVNPAKLRGLTIMVPRSVVLDDLEAAVAANFEAALERLGKAGAKIKRVAMPVLQKVRDLQAKRGTLLGAEALHVHYDRVHGRDAESMDGRVVERILTADRMTAVDILTVLDERRRLIAEAEAEMEGAVVACPTTPCVAPLSAPLEADRKEFFRANALALRNTSLGNFLDWCGVSLPNGKDRDGMPTGFLLSAVHGADAAVLSAAWGAEETVAG